YYVDVQNQRMKRYRLDYMIQLGDAIDYLHRQRWIHRDICPRNMIIDEQNTLKLIDFGLVVPNTEPFRAPGNRTGTAAYMAPELIAGTIMEGLERNPDDRWQSAAAMADEFREAKARLEARHAGDK